jgi:site-specific DNA-methyltransferase (adenine-specific)
LFSERDSQGAIVQQSARLKLVVSNFAKFEAPSFPKLEPPSRVPRLPEKDNEPGSVEVLLAANRWWRQNPWPEPFNKTVHTVRRTDARSLDMVESNSVHLIVTSPPYFNIKPYESDAGGNQLARIDDYEDFLVELTKCMAEWSRVLMPGGRVCCVVGDVLVPRRKGGRHRILPLPADIMVQARKVGLDTLTPILWFKIGNRTNEAGGGSSGYYGKPYQPGAVIKNDFEHILMLRKPGAYRSTSMLQKALSMLQRDEMDAWQRPFWDDIRGASLRNGHPAPFPDDLAGRLVRMYSFAGDLVLDPFCGSGSTAVAACRAGRNSLSSDVETKYVEATVTRLKAELAHEARNGAYVRQVVYEPM